MVSGTSRPWWVALVAVMVGVAVVVAGITLRQPKTEVVVFGAGSAGSESYQLAEAIRDVLLLRGAVELRLVETAGSAESMALLEEGGADLILAQADTKPGRAAQLVARMFPEQFQLVARSGAGIGSVADLRGKRVGLAPAGSGQNASFWEVATHYGLDPDALEVTEGKDADLDERFVRGELDAVFRVRPPRNPGVRRLVREGGGVLVPIEQGEAITLEHFALERSLIPRGAYQGEPPVPAEDLPTLAAPRLLLAHARTDPWIVREITAALFELRHPLVERMPLAGFISAPGTEQPSLVALHEGARRYYDREKPGYLQANADVLALVLTGILGVASWLWGAKRSLERARKDRADRHNLELTALMRQAAEATTREEIVEIRRRLVGIFEQVVRELDQGRLDAESLQSFALVWNAASHAARDQEGVLGKA